MAGGYLKKHKLFINFGGYSDRLLGSLLRSEWNVPVNMCRLKKAWCCRCSDALLDENWDERIAQYVLTEKEWFYWRGLKNRALSRKWLRGRIAAKDAIKLLLLNCHDIVAPLETISVLRNQNGKPEVHLKFAPELERRISISISHCSNMSIAMAADSFRLGVGMGIGIDVENLLENHQGLQEGGFSSSEISLLNEIGSNAKEEWLIKMWCAKEAAGKALGTGLKWNPISFAVTRLSTEESVIYISENESEKVMPAKVGSEEGIVFAVARI